MIHKIQFPLRKVFCDIDVCSITGFFHGINKHLKYYKYEKSYVLKIAVIIILLTILIPVYAQTEEQIPDWIKNNAGWWSEGLIEDSEFLQGMQFLIEKGIIVIPETVSTSKSNESIPDWIKNNARWWSEDQIEDSDFVSGIQYLIKKGILLIDYHAYENNISKMTKVSPDNSLFFVYGIGESVVIKEDTISWNIFLIQLNPEMTEVYKEIGVYDEPKKTVVLLPALTAFAYDEPGFYTFYRGECDKNCLTVSLETELVTRSTSSSIGSQVLELLGYDIVFDIMIDADPSILEQYDKVILLHNEYVTKKMFDVITNHPNVIYLYPNALYAEVSINYQDATMTLLRGHNYPQQEIRNGFGWEFDNSEEEYDTDCLEVTFYRIDNGWMLNCYPEEIIAKDMTLLKTIKNF